YWSKVKSGWMWKWSGAAAQATNGTFTSPASRRYWSKGYKSPTIAMSAPFSTYMFSLVIASFTPPAILQTRELSMAMVFGAGRGKISGAAKGAVRQQAQGGNSSGKGLNSTIYPDYLFSCLSQSCPVVRVCSQGKKYKALLIHFIMEFSNLLYPV